MTDLRTFDEDAADRFDERERARRDQEAKWDERVREVERTLTPRESERMQAALAQGRGRREWLICAWQAREDRARPTEEKEWRERELAEGEEAAARDWRRSFAAAPKEAVHYASEVGTRGRRVS